MGHTGMIDIKEIKEREREIKERRDSCSFFFLS
jgi:hypothetical protein